MINAYVIAETEYQLDILKKLLPSELRDSTVFAEGTNRYGAYSMAGTLLATRHRPVALFLDANTEDERTVQEQEDFLRELLQRSATQLESRYQIFIAVPTLEVVFFRDKALLEQLTDYKLSDIEWTLASHA